MGVSMPVVLSRPQFVQVVNAAAPLYPLDRDLFISAVAAELEGRSIIGDGDVGRAIREVQPRFAHPEPPAAASISRWDRERPKFERSSKRAY
jgi:hypothetical protein